jgi:type IV conjugative transfer system protein TraL
MLPDHTRHYLLNYLDRPVRFLFFTIGEFCTLGGPVFLGMFFGWAGTGFLLGVLGYIALRFVKKSLGGGLLKHAIYWYLPTSRKTYKLRIPSHIREFIG